MLIIIICVRRVYLDVGSLGTAIFLDVFCLFVFILITACSPLLIFERAQNTYRVMRAVAYEGISNKLFLLLKQALF